MKPKKPAKKVIPFWASVEGVEKAYAPPAARSSVAVIEQAIAEIGDAKGVASIVGIKKFVRKTQPTWSKSTLKRTMARALEKKAIIQVTGKGPYAGSFKVAKQPKDKKKRYF